MVQRYDPDVNCHLSDDGDYVEYSEYEKIINSHKELVEALNKYGCHNNECNEYGGAKCICGFEQALKEEAEKPK